MDLLDEIPYLDIVDYVIFLFFLRHRSKFVSIGQDCGDTQITDIFL